MSPNAPLISLRLRDRLKDSSPALECSKVRLAYVRSSILLHPQLVTSADVSLRYCPNMEISSQARLWLLYRLIWEAR